MKRYVVLRGGFIERQVDLLGKMKDGGEHEWRRTFWMAAESAWTHKAEP